MPEGRKIDFLVIGAPKAGTTSLFEYLRTHPRLHLPRFKETNFFLDHTYGRGVDWYFDWILAGSAPGLVNGEVSVRYMAGTSRTEEAAEKAGTFGDEPGLDPEQVVPARIHAALPEAKLIALLRDPVGRCVSEYGMATLRGAETRSLDEAITELLRPEELTKARACFSATDACIVQGEYGRILAPYFELFPPENIMVLYTKELADDAADVMRRIFAFVGVDEDFTPPNLGERYLEQASKPRSRAFDVPGLTRRLRRHEGLLSTWERIPIGVRQRLWTMVFFVEKWNRSSPEGKPAPALSPAVESALRAHYAPDRERLAALTGTEPPWR
jgi:Sulfotransferase domain